MLKNRPRIAFHVFAAVSVLGLWLLTRPNSGLRHDAVLYLAQAMKWSRPAQFDQDLFFAFGSQDRYSIYGLIFGPIFQLAEPWLVQPLVLGLCHAAFLAAVWRLLPSQLSLRLRWLSMAALALLRPLYGGLNIVGYCEPFLTARSVAEPLALWAIVCLHQQGRIWTAWLLIVAALAIHPLMSAPAALCLWLLSCTRDRRWLVLLPLGVGAVAVLAALGIPPFDAFFKQYPDDWWKLVTTNDQVLVKNWRSEDWAAVTMDFVTLGGGWALYRSRERSLVPAVLISAGVLLTLTVLGSQFQRNILITQLQLWRGLWMVRALAVALTPCLLLTLARKGPAGPATACSLACVLSMTNLHWDTAWIGMIWPALHLWIWRTRQSVSPFVLRMSVAASTAGLLIVGVYEYFRQRSFPVDDVTFLDASAVGIALVVSPLLALAFLVWLWRAHWRRQPEVVRSTLKYGGPGVAILLLLTGCLLWDRRPPLTRYLESHLHSPHPFEEFVPARTAVYWDNSLAAAWFLLKRPSYFSPAQGAGVLFNQATARAWDERHKPFGPIALRRNSCETFTVFLRKLPDGTPPCAALLEHEVEAVCRKAPDLQFLVSAELYTRKPLAVWEVPQGREPFKTEYLYACSSFR